MHTIDVTSSVPVITPIHTLQTCVRKAKRHPSLHTAARPSMGSTAPALEPLKKKKQMEVKMEPTNRPKSLKPLSR